MDQRTRILTEAKKNGLDLTGISVHLSQDGATFHGSLTCGMNVSPKSVSLTLEGILSNQEWMCRCVGMTAAGVKSLDGLTTKIGNVNRIITLLDELKEAIEADGADIRTLNQIANMISQIGRPENAQHLSLELWLHKVSSAAEAFYQDTLKRHLPELLAQVEEEVLKDLLPSGELEKKYGIGGIFDEARAAAREQLRADPRRILVMEHREHGEMVLDSGVKSDILWEAYPSDKVTLLELPYFYYGQVRYCDHIELDGPLEPQEMETISTLLSDGGMYEDLSEARKAAQALR